MDRRHVLGATGEEAAAWFLRRQGARVEHRNVRVGGGELDLVISLAGERAVVEVRTVKGSLRLDDRFPVAKRRQVHALARKLGIFRVDVVGVVVVETGVDFHWLRRVPSD